MSVYIGVFLEGVSLFQVGLLDRLTRIVPKGLDTHVFANSGSEVVENAIKMARAHTKKTNIISFDVSLLKYQEKI